MKWKENVLFELARLGKITRYFPLRTDWNSLRQIDLAKDSEGNLYLVGVYSFFSIEKKNETESVLQLYKGREGTQIIPAGIAHWITRIRRPRLLSLLNQECSLLQAMEDEDVGIVYRFYSEKPAQFQPLEEIEFSEADDCFFSRPDNYEGLKAFL